MCPPLGMLYKRATLAALDELEADHANPADHNSGKLSSVSREH
jgi:hypothetical protein